MPSRILTSIPCGLRRGSVLQSVWHGVWRAGVAADRKGSGIAGAGIGPSRWIPWRRPHRLADQMSTKSQPDASLESDEIRIGISACLLGERVRYDGGHKQDRYLTETLSKFVSFVPVCPEAELGLGVPRESLRLERASKDASEPALISKSGADLTARMRRFSEQRVRAIARQDLCGYVLKKDSPSCGLMRVRVYDWNGAPSKDGRGIFAQVLAEQLPLLPVEEEGRLHDPPLRENFLERVFAYRRLKNLFRERWRAADLVRFHTAEKLLLLAHDERLYRELGRLVARVKELPRAQLRADYEAGFMQALGKRATPRRHVNVLQHAAGYFKQLADERDRDELRDVIRDFHVGLVPLIVPITLVRHLVRRFEVEYLAGQTYLEPNPKELMLRNHV